MPAHELKLVNVNLPRDPRGLIWTRVSVRQYDGVIVPTKDPLGRELYWFSVTPLEGAEEGTDRWAVEQRWISMVTRVDREKSTRRRDQLLRHASTRLFGCVKQTLLPCGRYSRSTVTGERTSECFARGSR